MSLYQKLVGNVLFPLHESLKGHDTTAVHKSLEQSQWLTPDGVAAVQRDNLRCFLERIGRTVPYYRALFAQLGFEPGRGDVSALQQLPLLDKPTIRAQGDALKAEGATGLKRCNTGGSSGEPLIFWLEPGAGESRRGGQAPRDPLVGGGYRVDPEVVVWGSPIELGSQDRVRLLRDKLFRHRAAVRFRDVPGQSLQIRGAYPGRPAGDAVRLPFVPGTDCRIRP